MGEAPSRYHAFAHPTVRDLKQKSVRGGFVTVCAQGVRFILQTGTVMLLARLLSPEDFGLQGMVVALTGFLALFRDAGLGTATVQRLEVTQEQTSTLFWINAAVGTALAMCTVALAPVLVSFYHEPRLYWIAVASGAAFMFNGLAAQHQALLALEAATAGDVEADPALAATVPPSESGVLRARFGQKPLRDT